MNNDLLDLANSLEQLANEIEEISSSLSKIYVKELMIGLIKFSPVDTSQLISNWVVTINAKPEIKLSSHVTGKKGSTREISGAKSLVDAINVLKKIKSGDKIYVSNLAPQVVYTNYGTTNQAPQYFIEKAMQYAERAVDINNLKIILDAKK